MKLRGECLSLDWSRRRREASVIIEARHTHFTPNALTKA